MERTRSQLTSRTARTHTALAPRRLDLFASASDKVLPPIIVEPPQSKYRQGDVELLDFEIPRPTRQYYTQPLPQMPHSEASCDPWEKREPSPDPSIECPYNLEVGREEIDAERSGYRPTQIPSQRAEIVACYTDGIVVYIHRTAETRWKNGIPPIRGDASTHSRVRQRSGYARESGIDVIVDIVPANE